MPESTEPRPRRRFSLGPLVPIAFIGGFVTLFVWNCNVTGHVTDAARAYLADLRHGRVHEAYEMLSTQRRHELTEAQFESALGTPVLRTATEFAWDSSETGDGGRACVIGGVETPQGTIHIRLFVLDEDDAYRIHWVQLYRGGHPNQGPWGCVGQ